MSADKLGKRYESFGIKLDNCGNKLPKLPWTDYLTECWNLSGPYHLDYIAYVREMNSRGYCVLMPSQETWTRD